MLQQLNQKINIIKVVKIAFGSCLAILFADMLGLENSLATGIITLLSIQDTKKETFSLALKRATSFMVTILSTFVIYNGLGYHHISFGIFMLIMVGISYYFKWEGAVSVNAVIGTHFILKQSFAISFILNEALLVFIGVGIGVLLNLYMPDKVKAIKKDIAKIEDDLQLMLNQMAKCLMECDKHSSYNKDSIKRLERHVDEALGRAFENMHNTLYSHSRYYIEYMEMRKSQCIVLHSAFNAIYSLTSTPKQASIIAAFVEHVSKSLHEKNNVEGLMKEMKEIILAMKEEPLPVSQLEFENRAVLYHVLNDIEDFLMLKKDFVTKLSNEQIDIYWK